MDNSKKVSDDELNRLHTFTIKHFVEYYDLQMELTDHLANAIETRWQQEPQLSFENALQQEFKKFGIFGFMTVVEQRQLALNKKYNKLCLGYLREFFRLSKIILSVLAMAIIFKAAMLSTLVFPLLLGGLMIVSVFRLFHMAYSYRRKIKKTGRRWMLEEIIYRAGGAGLAFVMPFHLNSRIITGEVTSFWFAALLSVWVVVFSLYQYIILFYIPGRAGEHLENTYPEYKLQQAI